MKIEERSQRKLTASTSPFSTTRDEKVNLPKYKKIRIVSSCGADKLMLRLHHVVVLKVTLGFT